jgi:hypothetical protein
MSFVYFSGTGVSAPQFLPGSVRIALKVLTKLRTHYESRLFIAPYREGCCITNEFGKKAILSKYTL